MSMYWRAVGMFDQSTSGHARSDGISMILKIEIVSCWKHFPLVAMNMRCSSKQIGSMHSGDHHQQNPEITIFFSIHYDGIFWLASISDDGIHRRSFYPHK